MQMDLACGSIVVESYTMSIHPSESSRKSNLTYFMICNEKKSSLHDRRVIHTHISF
jgi:hypothetical protein